MIRGVRFGRMFANATFESFEVSRFNERAFEACKQMARSEIGGVVLIGPGGVGKTHLLHALAQEFDRLQISVPEREDGLRESIAISSASELIRDAELELSEERSGPTLSSDEFERHVSIDYWPMLDLADRLRRAALHGGGTEISEECCTCGLLILDDLGHEKTSEFIVQEFRRIIDWRYREMLPIAIATNLTEADLIEKYEEHTYSRWLGSCKILEIGGSDFRRDRGPADCQQPV